MRRVASRVAAPVRRLFRRVLRLLLGESVVTVPYGAEPGRADTPAYASEQDRELPAGVLNRDGMLRLAFQFVYGNRMHGDYLEFGSFTARTFRMAYRHSRRPYRRESAAFEQPIHLWAFDSFQGLPAPSDLDRFPAWTQGALRTDLEVFHATLHQDGIPRDAYTTVPGFYEDTLTDELQERMRGVLAAVAFVDCDFYESTVAVLRFLVPFLQAGTVLCFDDYYCYRADPNHGEQRAIREFLEANRQVALAPWHDFGWHGKSFIVQLAG